MFSLEPSVEFIRRLAPLDGKVLGLMLAGILLEPAYLANHVRILTLLHWTLVLAKGQRSPTKNDLTSLFSAMLGHSAALSEDPPEDAFVDIVWTTQAGFKILPGIYTGVGYHLQRLINIAEQNEDSVASVSGYRDVVALLGLSDAVAARCGLSAGIFEDSQPRARLRPNARYALELGLHTRFRAEALVELGIERKQLNRFVLQPTSDLLDQTFGMTDLDYRPLIEWEDGIQVVSPSGLVAAARAHMVESLGPRFAEHVYLKDLERWLKVDLPRAHATPLPARELAVSDPGWSKSIEDRVVMLEIDRDKQAHLLLLEAKWPPSRDNPVPSPLGGGRLLTAALNRLVRELYDEGEGKSGTDIGLTVVVHNSAGWDLKIEELPDIGPRWFVVSMSAYSFSTLLRVPGFKMLKLWKMLAELRALSRRGIIIKLWPDPLFAWSVWEDFGFTFTPALADLRGTALFGDTALVAPLVRRMREAWRTHGVRNPWGELRVVERSPDDDDTTPNQPHPIYFDLLEIVRGTLLGVVETKHSPWWVSVGRPPIDAEDRQFLYLLWQAVLEWLARAAEGATEQLSADARPILVTLLPIPMNITDGPDSAKFFYSLDGTEVRIALPADLRARMAREDNSAELQVMAWVLEGVLTLRGKATRVDAMAWARETLANPHLKMIHINQDTDQAFTIDLLQDKTRYRPLQEHDLATAGRWMDERLIARGSLTVAQPMTWIDDAEQVNGILNAAVDAHWEACRNYLTHLDRTETLHLVLGLIEAVHRHRIDDERGARARRIAYADDPDLGVRRINQRDRAFRTYRVVAEMALCACPVTGGRRPGLSDIDAIAAHVTTLVRMAELSDAVKRKLVKGRLSFLLDGSLLPYRGGAEAYMAQYLRACLKEVVTLDEEGYSSLFDTPQNSAESDAGHDDISRDTEADGIRIFELAVREEFGLTASEIWIITFSLHSVAAERLSEVLCLKRSELSAAVIAKAKQLGHAITSDAFGHFLMAFGLSTRPAWDKPPPGFESNDIFPWFFERRLALMTRPLLILSEDGDPQIMYGIRQISMGTEYALTLLERGIWEKAKLRSSAAKAYVDAEIARRGRAFESKVAQIFATVGWTPLKSIRMEHVGASKKYGDIDVLAVSADGTTWVITECKWFGAARTPREVAAWMQDFHGREGDKLHKHLQRCEWIETNASIVAHHLRLDPPEKILTRLVTTRPTPLAYASEIPARAYICTERQLLTEFRTNIIGKVKNINTA